MTHPALALFQAMGALHATFSSLLHSLCTATTADTSEITGDGSMQVTGM